jgi:hypothetical protein
MQITECRFGRLTIDGVSYDRDVIIHNGRVYPDWYRKKGHSLSMDDLEIILTGPPEVLVLGRGHLKVMRVPDGTRAALAEHGIEPIDLSTPKAVARFMELLPGDRRVSAAFHLSC